MSQVQVSRLENPDYSGASLNSLKRIAQACDLGLIVRMGSFGEFVDWIVSMSPERLVPPNYAEEQEQRRVGLEHALMADAIAAEQLGGDYQGIYGNIPTSTAPEFTVRARTIVWANYLAAEGVEKRQLIIWSAQGGREFAVAA
jgi:hypothetical protein